MKILNKLLIVLSILYMGLAFYGCSDNLEEHVAITDSNLQKSLTQRIAEDSELSKFSELLGQSGYDEILNASKSYTVWIPDNEAMSMVSSEMLNDAEQLDRFISNHIALSSFSTDMIKDTLSVQMLSNKYADFVDTPSSIAGVHISLADQYAANGVYHIIDHDLAPRFNLWEYIVANPGNHEQNSFIGSLDSFDLFNVEQQIEGDVEEARDTLANELLRIYDLQDEKKKFTYFLMADDGFELEKEKLMPYSQRKSEDSTQMLAQFNVVKDLVFKGVYTPNMLPDTLTSIYGVKVSINQENFIGEPVLLSNGIVYIVDRMDVKLENKLVPIKIEGENPISFSHNRNDNLFYREKIDPSGVYFEDLVVRNHGVANFTVNYRVSKLYSTTYKVYFRAVNDFEGEFKQRLRIGGRYVVQEDETVELVDVIADNPAVWIYPNVYEEIYAGEFTLEQAGNIDRISLIAENTSDDRWNPLTLDYMILVPNIE
jgi:uncharacterized surface protein with fasciclin (FAS1) repeats